MGGGKWRILFCVICFLSCSFAVFAQKRVSGTVVDANGEPLIGVNVVEKDATNGTVTDLEGRFTLNVQNSAILQFSYVGYITQEIATGNQTNLEITLLEDSQALEEVVVIGYGTRVKGALTGAVSKVDNKVFEGRPLTNTMNALQGALPGVTVTRGSGRPGGENYSLQIRGTSSYSGNKPLVLVDGVPGDLYYVNPNDIADITVLKDAAASIYGARAADGVVLVTTKKGKQGKPSITYSGNFGIKTPQYLKRPANTLQLAEMYDEGMRNVGMRGVSEEVFAKIRASAAPEPGNGWMLFLENYPGFYGSTDWTDEVYDTGTLQMHNLSISGGGDNSTYLFSAGYDRDEGLLHYGENHSDRYNLRMNYDFKLFDRLTVETRNSFENQTIVEPAGLNETLRALCRVWSYLPVYNPLGQFYGYQGYSNPVQAMEEGGDRHLSESKFSTNTKGELKILDDLKLVAQMGVVLTYRNDNVNNKTYERHTWDGGTEGYSNNPNNASYSNSRNVYGIYTAYLDYNRLFGKHQLNLMAGASHEENDYQSQSTTGYNFISNELFTLNMADKTKVEYINFTGDANDWALSSYFGRVGYSFDKKYYLDFTARVDGSSKFAPSKRWSAVFPSASASWNLSEENFIRSLNLFDNLKLRLSWGQAGNQELSFGNYDYISLISITGTYPMGSPNVGLTGAVPSIASEARTWETIESRNIGLDLSTLNARLSASFDYYNKYNNKMLINDQLPAVLGGSAPTQNIGKLKTHGWDFSIGWRDQVGDFRYGISAIISDSQNKLIELKGNDSYGEGLIKAREGYALDSYFGYQFDGMIQNEAQLNEYKKLGGLVPTQISLGDVMFSDLDGDGKITTFGDGTPENPGDMTYLGNMTPRYIYSGNIDLSYRNVDFSLFLQGVGKRNGIRYGDFGQPYYFVWHQPLAYFYGKNWTPDNPGAPYPRITPGGVGYDNIRDWNWRASSLRINDLSYLRFKLISIGYNAPKAFSSKLKMQNARIYLSAQDLFTISKGSWDNNFDPEETYERNDEQTYPFSSVISLGLEIRF
ncbi:MAG: TonB-dependent receptor [Tannerella sp.]|nr:TonB-dependent receptor [Tannerella sp.]